MSHMVLPHVMTRIRGAKADSPIAVFVSDKPGCVDAVFAATILTRQRLASCETDPGYIGVFDERDHPGEVRALIADRMIEAQRAALREHP